MPASHYFGGSYSSGNSQANSTGRLNDTADSNFVDAGYQLEWDLADLANGDTWTIEAYEGFTDPTPVQILVPGSQLSVDDTTLSMEFGVHNLDSSQRTFNLSANSSLGWTVDLLGGSSVTIDALTNVTVQMNITIPSGLAVDTVSTITLSASDGSGSGSSATTITIFSPNYTISPSELNFGNVSMGGSSTNSITLSNSGSDVVVGTVGSLNGLTAPFSITANACDGQTITNGNNCIINIKFEPSADISSNDLFNIPILAPVMTSASISVSGTGVYTVTVSSTAGGSTDKDGENTMNHGDLLTITPTAITGYHFTGWSGDAGGTDNPLTVTVTTHMTITANFAANQHTVNVNASSGGSTDKDGENTMNHGDSLTITPTAATGYHFTGWSGDAGGTDNPLTVTVIAHMTITANFTANQHTTNVNASSGGSTDKDGENTVNHGDTLTIAPTPDTNFYFLNWTGDATGDDNPLTLTVTSDMTITANFSGNQNNFYLPPVYMLLFGD